MSQLISHLTKLGLSTKQAELFLELYQHGPKPASSLAKSLNAERTNIYKMAQVLVAQWILWQSSKNGTTIFYIADKEIFRKKLEIEKNELDEKEVLLPQLEQELLALEGANHSPVPKMRFFEGRSGLDSFFEDMMDQIIKQWIILVKCFASNTLESQSHSHELQEIAWAFIKSLEKNSIHVQLHLGNGILTLEQVMKTDNPEILKKLPAGNSSVNIFLVWKMMYVMIYKQIPFGLKVESEELTDVMHFLLKSLA